MTSIENDVIKAMTCGCVGGEYARELIRRIRLEVAAETRESSAQIVESFLTCFGIDCCRKHADATPEDMAKAVREGHR